MTGYIPSVIDEDEPSRGYVLANRIGGGVIGALGIAIAISGIQLGFLRATLPGPGFYPVIIGAVLAVFGGSLLVAARGEGKVRGEDSRLPDRRGAIAIAATFVFTVVFLIILEPLGYVGSMVLFLGGILAVVTRMKWWWIALIAVVFSVGTFYAFDAGLGVPLPESHLLPLAWLGF